MRMPIHLTGLDQEKYWTGNTVVNKRQGKITRYISYVDNYREVCSVIHTNSVKNVQPL